MIKKLIPVLLLVLVLFSLTAVSAADDVAISTDSNAIGSFADLNKTISENTCSTLVLNQDYSFNISDLDFINGITINQKDLIIDGNGHTIDAKGFAHIFNVNSNNVILKNIKFINSSYTGYGAALYINANNVTIVNCTFENNIAKGKNIGFGGAIFFNKGQNIIKNCVFIDNKAYKGAAVHVNSKAKGDINISYCLFINNVADTINVIGTASNGPNIYANNNYWDNKAPIEDIDYTKSKVIVNNYIIIKITQKMENGVDIEFVSNDNTPLNGTMPNLTVDVNVLWYNNPTPTSYKDKNISNNKVTIAEGGNVARYVNVTKDGILLDSYTHTLVVTNHTFEAIQKAIDLAWDGDTIYLEDATYTNNWSKEIVINKNITIVGNGAILDAGMLSRIFNIASNQTLTLSNITFTKGNYSTGGAIYVSKGAKLEVSDSSFIKNSCIHSTYGGPEFEYSGGAILNAGTTVVDNCYFKENYVDVQDSYNGGGAIANSGTLTVNNSEFFNNTAEWDGGAIFGDIGKIYIDNCKFNNNRAYQGGTIWASEEIIIKNSEIANGTTLNGFTSNAIAGGVYLVVATATVENCSFINNTGNSGAAITNFAGTIEVSDSKFVDNSAINNGERGYGGAFWNYGQGSYISEAIISNCEFDSNNATDSAGVLSNKQGNLVIKKSNFTGSNAPNGGVLTNDKNGNITIEESIFESNIATGKGGVIDSIDGNLVISDSSFINNIAQNGSVVFNEAGSALNISNSIIIPAAGDDKAPIDNKGTIKSEVVLTVLGGEQQEVVYGQNYILWATVETDGIVIADGSLTFTLNNKNYVATCDEQGIFKATVNIDFIGIKNVTANYNGTAGAKIITTGSLKSIESSIIYVALEENGGSDDNPGTFDKPVATLEHALKFVKESGYIVFKDGATYILNNININKTVHINSTDGNAVLSGNNTNRILNITANNVVLEDLIIANGYLANGNGAGIYWTGDNGTIKDCFITNNVARSSGNLGGAIYSIGDNFTVDNCNFTHNLAAPAWSGIVSDRDIDGGGSLYIGGNNALIKNSSFADAGYYTGSNIPIHCAGALFINGTNAQVLDSSFKNLTIYTHAGAILTTINAENFTIRNSNFTDIKGNNGGALTVKSSSVIDNCIFDNCAACFGNAILAGRGQIGESASIQTLVINDCTFINCHSLDSESSLANGALNIHREVVNAILSGNILFENCSATEKTGWGDGAAAIYNECKNLIVEDNLSIVNCKCDCNEKGNSRGGAIVNYGIMEVTGVLNITNCSAISEGGAILNEGYSDDDRFPGNLIISGSAYFNNNNAIIGGAISNNGDGQLIINGSVEFNYNNATNGSAISNKGILNLTGNITINSVDDKAPINNKGVIKSEVVLTVLGGKSQDVVYGQKYTLWATVTASGIVVSDGNLTFTVNGTTYTATSDETGKFIVTIPINFIGAQNVTATYTAGNKTSVNVTLNSIQSDVIYVAANGSNDNPGTFDKPVATLEHALDVVGNNGKIIFIGENDVQNIRINKNVTLTGIENAILNGKKSRILVIANGATVTISNLIFKNGKVSTDGAAIDIERSTLIINDNVAFIDNTATNGGAIYNNGNLIIKGANVSFMNNHGDNGGAIEVLANAVCNITSSVNFVNNTGKYGNDIYVASGAKLAVYVDCTSNTVSSIYTKGTIVTDVIVTVLGNKTIEVPKGDVYTVTATATAGKLSISNIGMNLTLNGVSKKATFNKKAGVYSAVFDIDFEAVVPVTAIVTSSKKVVANPIVIPATINATCPQVVYVKADGNDTTGDGSHDKPFATLEHALTVVSKTGKIIFIGENIVQNAIIAQNVTLAGENGTLTANKSGRILNIINGATVTITDLVLKDAYYDGKGGAINVDASTLIIRDNVSFVNNTLVSKSGNNGGAIYSLNSNVIINGANVTFINNYGRSGGAIMTSGNESVLTILSNVIFINNTCHGDYGNDMYLGKDTHAAIYANCISTNNIASIHSNNAIIDSQVVITILANKYAVYYGDSVTLNATLTVGNLSLRTQDPMILNITKNGKVIVSVSGTYVYKFSVTADSLGDIVVGAELNDTKITNYTVVPATISVSKANATIKWEAYTITYGNEGIIGWVRLYDDHSGIMQVYIDGVLYGEYNLTKITTNVYAITINTTYDAGKHNVTIKINDPYYAVKDVNGTFTVTKADAAINVTVKDITYGEYPEIVVGLYDGFNGTVIITINGTVVFNDTPTEIINNTFTFKYDAKKLNAGTYDVNVAVDDKNYEASPVDTTFVVKPAQGSMDITVENITYGEDATVIITLFEGADGALKVKINGTTIFNGRVNTTTKEITIKNLAAGNYTVEVTFSNPNYKILNQKVNFAVAKATPIMDVTGSVVVIGHASYIDVLITNPELFNGTIKVMGMSVDITNGTKRVYIQIYPTFGEFDVPVEFIGNQNYTGYKTSVKVIVKGLDPELSINATNGGNGNDILVNVTINENATGNITFFVDGVEYGTQDVSNTTILIKPVTLGKHTVTVRYNSDGKFVNDTAIADVFVKGTQMNVTYQNITYGEKLVVTVTVPKGSNGTITIVIKDKDNNVVYTSKPASCTSGRAVFTITQKAAPELIPGEYLIFVSYNGTDRIIENLSSYLTVKKVHGYIENVSASSVIYGDDVYVVVDLYDYTTGVVTLTLSNGQVFKLPIDKSRMIFTIPNLEGGIYVASVSIDDPYYYYDVVSTTFIVKKEGYILSADDLSKYFKGPESFNVKLTDMYGTPLVNKTVAITICGKTYYKVTDDKGIAKLNINLNPGVYEVTSAYDNQLIVNNVTVLNTLQTQDLIKIYKNGTQFYAYACDGNGDALAEGTNITFTICGKTYYRAVDSNGYAKLNINLAPGEYEIETYNPITGERVTNKVTVLSYITANGVIKNQSEPGYISVDLVDETGSPLANVTVQILIVGKIYNRTTDENGTARLNINLLPGTYEAIAKYGDLTSTCTAVVLKD